MGTINKKNVKNPSIKVNWRIAWYSLLVWLLAFATSGFVILPWFYLVLPTAVLATTALFFKKARIFKKRRGRKKEENTFAFGLWISLLWFSVVLSLDFVNFIGFDKLAATNYFFDFRNWAKYPIIILIPVIYSIVLENYRKRKKKKASRRGHNL